MSAKGLADAVAHESSLEDAALMAATQKPVSIRCVEEPMTKPGWTEKPSWFLVAERDRMIAPETQRFMAGRSGARTLTSEVDHTPLASAPQHVVSIIADAVHATQDADVPKSAGKRRTQMRVVSVNVGMPRETVWKDMAVRTGIFKDPVAGPVMIKKLNLSGDGQADLTVHGGEEKAVYAYPAEHYEYWQSALPDVPFSWGHFGENLTTEGLFETTLCIGDHLRIGSAVLRVTQPRMPCYKLNLRFDRDDMIKRFLLSGRSGFYFSVAEPGEVTAGSEVEILSRDPHRVTVSDIVRLYLAPTRDPDLLKRAMDVADLPVTWKDQLQLKADVDVSGRP